MLGNGVCDTVCMKAECDNDRGDCNARLCSPGCFPYQINDNNCQEACHVPACNWDGYDCDCNPGCTSDLLNNDVCDDVCNVDWCDFDQFNCGDCASGCFFGMLGDNNCDPVCNVKECGYDRMDCGCAAGCNFEDLGTCKAECLVPECHYGSLDEECLQDIDSVSCDSATCSSNQCSYEVSCCGSLVPVLLDCSGTCWQLGFVTSTMHPSVCVGRIEPSSSDNPRVLYVSASPSASEGDGTLENPFSSLSVVSYQYRARYVDIVLLPGVHLMTISGSFFQNFANYLSKFTRITIDSFECRFTDHCQPATIYRVNQDNVSVFVAMRAEFIVANVTFSSPYSDLSYFDSSLFRAVGGKLSLLNVDFLHFDQVVNQIIYSMRSEVSLSNVNFVGLSLNNVTDATGALIRTAGFIQLHYSGGTVSFLNNQYDQSGLFTTGFLCAIEAAFLIENVTFEYNIVDSVAVSNSPNCQSLIGIMHCFACEVKNCTFRNNIGFLGTVLLYFFSSLDGLTPHDEQQLQTSPLLMSNCIFENNTSSAGSTLFFNFTRAEQQIELINCTFRNELSAASTVGVLSQTVFE